MNITSAQLAATILNAIAATTFYFNGEAELQSGVMAALKKARIAADREVYIPGAGRIDFLAGRVGIECKVAGSPSSSTPQLIRYSETEALDSLVLVTTKASHARLPREIRGKPLLVHVLTGGLA